MLGVCQYIFKRNIFDQPIFFRAASKIKKIKKKKKYYVEVKSTNKSYGKLCFLISQFQFNFAAGTNDNFNFAFVKNARSNPQILWLKKESPL